MIETATFKYASPVGDILLAIRSGKLIGLWLEGQRYFGSTLTSDQSSMPSSMPSTRDEECRAKVVGWLDGYFQGKNPGSMPPIEMIGTEFQIKVWRYLTDIPAGCTSTYGAIARAIGSSPRAVGNAVGRNPLLLVVPCHRVIAADGSIGGYAAGEAVKRRLLLLENPGFHPRDGQWDEIKRD